MKIVPTRKGNGKMIMTIMIVFSNAFNKIENIQLHFSAIESTQFSFREPINYLPFINTYKTLLLLS